jgi:hypothetical protein
MTDFAAESKSLKVAMAKAYLVSRELPRGREAWL